MSTKLSNVINIIAQYEVVFEILWHLYWWLLSLKKNGGRESRKIQKMAYFKTLSRKTYDHILHLFLYMKQLLTYSEIKSGGNLKNGR